jgi:hypothetical protein
MNSIIHSNARQALRHDGAPSSASRLYTPAFRRHPAISPNTSAGQTDRTRGKLLDFISAESGRHLRDGLKSFCHSHDIRQMRSQENHALP